MIKFFLFCIIVVCFFTFEVVGQKISVGEFLVNMFGTIVGIGIVWWIINIIGGAGESTNNSKDKKESSWYVPNPRMTEDWNKDAKTIEGTARFEQRKTGRNEGYDGRIDVEIIPGGGQDMGIFGRFLDRNDGINDVHLHVLDNNGKEVFGQERQNYLSHNRDVNPGYREIPKGSCHYDNSLGEWIED